MDNVDDFTVHLPSNTRFTDANSASKYIVKLALPANLSGEWECSLREIHYPRSWHNVAKDEASIRLLVIDTATNHSEAFQTRIPSGYYASNLELVNAIQSAARNALARHPHKRSAMRVTYNRFTGKAVFHLPEHVSLGFSPALSTMLGIDVDPQGFKYVDENNSIPKHPMNINLVDSLYVYSDVVQSSLVGDVMAPLLRIVPVVGSYGEMCHIEYIKPVYFPVAKLTFSTIEIYITDSAGRKIKFRHGKTTVMLHFRRKKARI